MEKLLLDEHEAIALLGGPRRTRFLQLVTAGEITSVTIGRLRRYPREELLQYVERLCKSQSA